VCRIAGRFTESAYILESPLEKSFSADFGHDFHECIRVIEQADIEREYLETMQTVAQYLREEGIQQGMQQGMQAGLSRAQHKYAKKMLMIGLDETMIKEVTGLSAEEIDALK
jgi:predicted transposase/invertase (TIGR01784 family)